MKKSLLFAAALACLTSAHSQFPYSATVLNEYYLPLDNPTSLGIEVGWDDPEVQIPLDFSIDLDGNNTDGILMLGGTGEMLMNTTENGLLNIVWPISLDVMDIGAVEAEEFSSIQYQVTGESPNRILKVEWDECGLYDEISDLGTTTARLSFQTWIYESGGIIEYRFGPNTLNADTLQIDFLSSGIILGFDYDYYNGSFLMPIGDPANPTLELVTDFYDLYYEEFLTGYPADGTVYRFTPTGETLGMVETTAPDVLAWPNPTAGQVQVNFGGRHGWTLTDAVGREVLKGMGQDGVRLDLEALETGTYLFSLDNGQVERIVRH